MVQVKVDAAFYSAELEKILKNYKIEISDSAHWSLGKIKNNWSFQDPSGRKLAIDFDENRKDYLRTHKGSGELIARALGYKENVRNIIDLSAGLGIDAVFLSQIGFKVTSVERNPLLCFLLTEAQKNSERPEIRNIKWIFADALSYLEKIKVSEPTSCYFDPMYPEKKKSALPRQAMVLFREMVGDDADAEDVLKYAVRRPFVRTVVKRPVKGDTLGLKPDFELKSKLVRYDVYYPRKNIS